MDHIRIIIVLLETAQLNEKKIAFWFELQLVPKGPINNKSSLVRNGEDPLHWRIYVALGGDELGYIT